MRSMQKSLLRAFQTHTECYPYSRPYFRSFRIQTKIQKKWQGAQAFVPALPSRFTSLYKNESLQQQFQETHLRFKPVGFDDDKLKRRLARFVKKAMVRMSLFSDSVTPYLSSEFVTLTECRGQSH